MKETTALVKKEIKLADLSQDQKLDLVTEQLHYWEKQRYKVDFYDRVASIDHWMDLNTVAKALCFKNYGRNNIFKILRKHGVLLSSPYKQYHNQPKQRYINSGYFKVIIQDFKDSHGRDRINNKTVVSIKGTEYIRRILNEYQ